MGYFILYLGLCAIITIDFVLIMKTLFKLKEAIDKINKKLGNG